MEDLNLASLIIAAVGAAAALVALFPELPKSFRLMLFFVGISAIAIAVVWAWPSALARPPTPISTSSTNSPQTTPTNMAHRDEVESVISYYNLMPNTSEGWDRLGPHLQLRTREDYEEFWSQISGVEILGQPEPRDHHVTIKIALHYRDGRKSRIEVHNLGLIKQGDRILIDSDELISSS